MAMKILSLCLFVLVSVVAHAADLVIAGDGKTDYQVVVPDQAADEVVDRWLLSTAKLIQAAFEKNGFKIEVVKEGAKAVDKPGIYLGATEFAKKNGIKVEQHDDWTYYQKVIGKDLVIAGNDRKDPARKIRGTETPLALLGTVKGACDFLRQYAGARFLFVNMEQSQYASRGGGLDGLQGNGRLPIDTRSIAFLPLQRIAVPADLDLQKKPMMKACADGNYETFYYIANNFFPLLSSVMGGTVYWNKVIPYEKYGKSHPEYFALLANGKRSCEPDFNSHDAWNPNYELPICPTHPEVQDLMVGAAEELIKAGDSTILIFPLDSYRLVYCNCERCMQLFGTEAERDFYARGRSGKLWQAYFAITERLREKHPGARVVIWDYQETPIQTVKEYPANVIPKLQFGKPADFDRLKGIRIPAGICGLEETFTGFGLCGPYAPERTPEHIAGIVQAMASNNVQWTTRDGAIGYVRGLQAPAYYVFGRMMDDPSADWKAINKEFCEAAFGDVAPAMEIFFGLLHEQMALYSDYFGVNMSLAGRKFGRSRLRDNKWHIQNIYTPEYMAEAEGLLASAERRTKDPDVKARLHLIRIEFDYLCGLSKIFALQDALKLHPMPEIQAALLDEIDAWFARLEALAGGTERSVFKPLDDWPEMRPFNGHYFNHAALQYDTYQQSWNMTSLGWDRAAIRAGILTNPPLIQVAAAAEMPAMNAAAWEKTPAVVFRERGAMPYAKIRTTLKALRDGDHLYVRIDSLSPSRNLKEMPEPKAESEVLKQEYVELGIRPKVNGPIYRLAANPTAGARYDAAWKPDAQNRLTGDTAWSCPWQFDFGATGNTWTAWFKVPLAELGGAAPAAGETWGFNAARHRMTPGGNRYTLWRNGSSVTDTNALGKLAF